MKKRCILFLNSLIFTPVIYVYSSLYVQEITGSVTEYKKGDKKYFWKSKNPLKILKVIVISIWCHISAWPEHK